MDDLIYIFNDITIISGQWQDDSERLCNGPPSYSWKEINLELDLNLAPDQQASVKPTELLGLQQWMACKNLNTFIVTSNKI